MLIVVTATVAIVLAAGFVYLRREHLGVEGVGLAALRGLAVGALILLLVNPGRSERQQGGDPVVLLDASLSMAVPGGAWEAAVDTARLLAEPNGHTYRFGSELTEFALDEPTDGASRITAALQAAVALGGPIYVVTDGELDDAGIVNPSLLRDVTVITLPRDTVADVAILELAVPERISSDDSVNITVTLGTWGEVGAATANLEISVEDRRVLIREVELPPSPGIARRTLVLPPGLIPSGTNVVKVEVVVPNDVIGDDNQRVRVVHATEQPAVVAILDPPDWEGRFLVAELAEIARTTVRGYAHITPDTWVEMGTGIRVAEDAVRRFARNAAMIVFRGEGAIAGIGRGGRPAWNWPTVVEDVGSSVQRDWYLSATLQASPLAGRLAFVKWDSLPPVHGLARLQAERGDWVAISARQGRRGAERPTFLGSDSLGVRSLTTYGTGWWRWRLRGGTAREAYRTLLAAGVDWLLESQPRDGNVSVISSSVVSRGDPIRFEWMRDEVPDSLEVSLLRDGDDTTVTRIARFDSRGVAYVAMPPGTYRWRVPGSAGVSVVEEYSDEFHPRTVASLAGGESGGAILLERFARDKWWLYVIVVAALSAEWAWRHRRGLS